jgi:DNA polymerase-3 subunit gamma/tau
VSKIPETVLSRSQVFEFKTISSRQIADQLRTIADAEKVVVDDSTLLLVARAAEGSMRDAQSAFDQVIAFAGQTVTAEDVTTVLGLVGRDLVLDIVAAVADETPAAAFELSGRAVELGYDLRSVVREISRVVRDLLVLSVDASRIDDPEIASESERDRLNALVARFSREDLLRAFDVLAKVEVDIRTAAQPRYHLEMAILRWIHIRKLVPLQELLSGAPAVSRVGPVDRARGPVAPKPASTLAGEGGQHVLKGYGAQPKSAAPVVPPVERRAPIGNSPSPSPANTAANPTVQSLGSGDEARNAFLTEIRKSKAMFYNTVVAQAQQIEFGNDRVTFSFLPAHRMLREQVEQNRPWLEQMAGGIAGKKMTVGAAQSEAPADAGAPVAAVAASSPPKPPDLKSTAMSDSAVQAMLDVFPAEIENVEEIE